MAARLPGFLVCVAISAAAAAVAALEEAAFGRAWIETLVLAILLGTALRSAWTPPARFRPGIVWSAKTLLEIAVVLLGASLSAGIVAAAGLPLLAGIALLVTVAIGASYAMGRLFGLPRRMAVLIACGNSICGNSAIAAVAPVIGAESRDVAASIAFTAVLGIAVVIGLPLLIPLLGLDETRFGVVAGLTVYAVPQVLAATAPAGPVAVQVGTLVKLVRVLMLGPVVLVLAALAPRLREPGEAVPEGRGRPRLTQLVPPFILGFLTLAALRTAGLVPEAALPVLGRAATLLTIVSMAALGLGVDLRTVAAAGPRVTATVIASLVLLGAAALGVAYGLVPA